MAKIGLIVGSVRHDRQGIKVARWMEQKLIDRNHVVFFIDPIEINLPLLDRMYKEMTNPSEKLIDLHEKIKAAEGYMPVTPEYNHSHFCCNEKYVGLLWKNIILNLLL